VLGEDNGGSHAYRLAAVFTERAAEGGYRFPVMTFDNRPEQPSRQQASA
jgi:hypothetical protein